MKFTKATLFKITLLIMLIAWFFGEDDFYDFLIFVGFGTLSYVFIFKLLIHFLLKKPLKNSVISLFCLFVYFFMFFDFEIAKLKGLIEIEKNIILFQDCCSEGCCEKLGNNWSLKSNNIMVTNVRGVGSNLKIYYVRRKNRYELKTNPFFPLGIYFRFECQSKTNQHIKEMGK